MTGVGRTQTISVHKYRRVARATERVVQYRLNHGWRSPEHPWARGARVEAVKGMFCVVLTERPGR